ncbi:phosphatidylserine decarboxylase [Sphingomonadaceae bacterium]|nr:phosphatidylserine decarboxylase [Sphingomonadaceae bacterium]
MAGDLQDNQGRGDAGEYWPTIHPDGRKYGVVATGISLALLFFTGLDFIAWPLLVLSAGIFAFFRDPERVVPQGSELVISPADGKICAIHQMEPPEQLQGENAAGQCGLPLGAVTRVSIFLSIFDVHINRTPVGGTVRRMVYAPGQYLNTDLDKSSAGNERQHYLIERSDGLLIGFTQIAGMVARRIVPFVKPGDIVAAGQRVGMIRFGSQVDVYLPAGTQPAVILGQRMIAGETVLARIGETNLVEGISL